MTDSPIAGWYPDPNDSASWRWWSGTGWTNDVAAREQAPAAAVSAPERRSADWGWADVRPGAPTAEESSAPAAAKPTGKANTPWIWLLAFSAYIWAAIVGAFQLLVYPALAAQDAGTAAVGVAVAALVPLWVLAGLDGRALTRRGFEAPSVLWMLLLPPIAYVVRRNVLLKRAGASSFGPQLALFLVTATVVAATVIQLGAIIGALDSLGLLPA